MNTKSKQHPYFTDYREYLQSTHWKSVKAKMYTKYPRTCLICGKKNTEAHHLRYDHLGQNKEWKDLIPLCRTHHELCHYAFLGLYKVPLTPTALMWRFRIVKWNKLGRFRPSMLFRYFTQYRV